MGISHWAVGLLGLFSGIVIASGLVAFLIGLNIIPRYAGITHTANHMILYENCAMAGAFFGNLFTLYHWNLPIGGWAAGLYGLFGGVFLGSWIIALTEILDIFPIMARRTGLARGETVLFRRGNTAKITGMGLIILSVALGKTLWSLLYYYKGW